MDIDQLIQRLQEIKTKHGGEIDVGFKKGDRFPYFDESMYADVKYIDSNFQFTNEFQPNAKVVVVIG
jgi:hypothetical protein